MQNTIKEELQQLIPANLVSSSEELSDAELESVAGGVIITGQDVRAQLRINGRTVLSLGPTNVRLPICQPSFRIGIVPIPRTLVESV